MFKIRNLEKEYNDAGFYCKADGLYTFIVERDDGIKFNFLEEFIDKKPTGKFGGPPKPFGLIKCMYMTC